MLQPRRQFRMCIPVFARSTMLYQAALSTLRCLVWMTDVTNGVTPQFAAFGPGVGIRGRCRV